MVHRLWKSAETHATVKEIEKKKTNQDFSRTPPWHECHSVEQLICRLILQNFLRLGRTRQFIWKMMLPPSFLWSWRFDDNWTLEISDEVLLWRREKGLTKLILKCFWTIIILCKFFTEKWVNSGSKKQVSGNIFRTQVLPFLAFSPKSFQKQFIFDSEFTHFSMTLFERLMKSKKHKKNSEETEIHRDSSDQVKLLWSYSCIFS